MILAWRGLGKRSSRIHVVEKYGDKYALCGYRVTRMWDLDPQYSWNQRRVTCAECLAAIGKENAQ